MQIYICIYLYLFLSIQICISLYQFLFFYRLLKNNEYSFLCHTICPCWLSILYISLVQSLSPVRLFPMPWTATCQASLSITNSQSLLKLMSIESVMPSSHLHPLSSPFPAFNLSHCECLFQLVSSLHQVAKVGPSASVIPVNIQD